MSEASRCILLRHEEREVIEAICTDGISYGDEAVELCVSIDLHEPYQVMVPSTGASAQSVDLECWCEDCSGLFQTKATVSHLPPIMLTLALPPLYPLSESAFIVTMDVMHSWLPPGAVEVIRRRVLDVLQEAAENGEGVVWRVYDLLQGPELLEDLGVSKLVSTRKRRLCVPSATPDALLPLLVAYNATVESSHFELASHACPICLTTVKGSKCTRLEECGHVCCTSCLTQFWNQAIDQGQSEKVTCVDAACVKAAVKTTDKAVCAVREGELLKVVGEESMTRWKRLKDKRLMEQDPTTVLCPNQACQELVPRPPTSHELDDNHHSYWENLRVCQSCALSFCVACRRTWHGPLVPCSTLNTDLQVYLAGTADLPERQKIERQYGKRRIEKLVAEFEQAERNKEWIEENTQECPGCHTNVEKSIGCNHVTCSRCSTHFCFGCGQRLRAENPYSHFSIKGTACYGKLFTQDAAENEWQPIVGFDLI